MGDGLGEGVGLTVGGFILTRYKVARKAPFACEAVSSMPACTDAVAEFECLDTGVKGDDVADYFVAWDPRKAGGHQLVFGNLVAV